VLLLEAIERLGAFPDLGPEVPEIGPGIRRLVFRRHIAIYAAGEQSLTVLRIIHQKQDVRRAVLP
jgi:plasmid stabilization system protein ParE